MISGRSWEHFHHQADIGVRGRGETPEEAFANAALALTAVITDPGSVAAAERITVRCEAPDRELLFVDWLNALVYEMATRKMFFSRFEVTMDNEHLTAEVWGEPISPSKHHPAVEVKGATYTQLKVGTGTDGQWLAQAVVDV